MNLFAMLAELLERDGDAVMVIDAGPQQPVEVTREQLWQRTLALRVDLEKLGIGRGDCVAVWLPNWSDALLWQFAASALGAHVIGVNTRYNVEEVAHVLQRARPRVIAVAHQFHGLDLIGRLKAAILASAVPAPVVAVVAGPGAAAVTDIDNYDAGSGCWLSAYDANVDGATATATATDDDALAVAFTTSGSTGKPKLAAHREAAVVAHALADAEAAGIVASDVVMCAPPLSGVFGFNTAMATLAAGAVCLLSPVFDEDAVVRDMARFGVTHVMGGDDMLSRIRTAWQRHPVALPDWRWLGIADFMGQSQNLAAWAHQEFGTQVTGVYGSSEVFALSLFWPPAEQIPHRWVAGGQLILPGMQARVVDTAGQVLATGQEGELQFCGPGVVDAYLGDAGAMDRSVAADGWFSTGDLARIGGDGGVEFICRMGDALRLRGFLVDPSEIEQRLLAHQGVRTAKVVGAQGADGSTVAVGFTVMTTESTASGEQLQSWCAQALAGFKVPSAIRIIEEMPTTSGTNGMKIRTAQLREWAQQSLRNV